MHSTSVQRVAADAAADAEASSLPAWVYRDAEFFERERRTIFRSAGMASSSYIMGPLAAGEVCLRSFARRLRAMIPESRLPQPPARGWSGG
jgi:hypothetical protein